MRRTKEVEGDDFPVPIFEARRSAGITAKREAQSGEDRLDNRLVIEATGEVKRLLRRLIR